MPIVTSGNWIKFLLLLCLSWEMLFRKSRTQNRLHEKIGIYWYAKGWILNLQSKLQCTYICSLISAANMRIPTFWKNDIHSNLYRFRVSGSLATKTSKNYTFENGGAMNDMRKATSASFRMRKILRSLKLKILRCTVHKLKRNIEKSFMMIMPVLSH